jgi:uncharacterized integral membrane protein
MRVEGRQMNSLRLIGGTILAAVVVVFTVQNTQVVTFHFLMFRVSNVSMALALFAAVVLGALLGWIVSTPNRFRRMRERRGLKDTIAAQSQSAAADPPSTTQTA